MDWARIGMLVVFPVVAAGGLWLLLKTEFFVGELLHRMDEFRMPGFPRGLALAWAKVVGIGLIVGGVAGFVLTAAGNQ